MFSQKESVYVAVKEFLKEKNIAHEDGELVSLDKDGRKAVIEMISQAAIAGQMSLSAEASSKYDSLEKMRGYVNGLLSNWLRKDTRLNGGGKYSPKNPGSRAGQGDEVIKNLKAFRSTLTEKSHIEAVDAEIEKRVAELKASKVKSKPVDFSKIPDSIKEMLGK